MRAGFGKACITPELGTPCALGLDNEAEEIFDDIFVRALCLADGAETMVALSVDVIGLNKPETRAIAERAARATGIAPERVVVHCTHTHQSPNSRIEYGEYLAEHGLRSYSPESWEQLQAGAETACRGAREDLQDARARYGEAEVAGIASNRRILDAHGRAALRGSRVTAEMREHPEGHIDPRVRVLAFERARDRVFAMCYCCHPSAAGGDEGPYLTGDFPGHALSLLENDALAGLHFTGPCGNINPGKYTVDTRKGDVARMGRILAQGVARALDAAEPVGDGCGWAREELRLPLRQGLPSLDELETRVLAGIEEFKGIKAEGKRLPGGGELRRNLAKLIVLRQAQGDELVSELVAWRIGEAAICFLPGECFLGIDEGIREAAVGPLLTVENCDYSPSYIPTPEAYEQGGYEASVAHVAPTAFSRVIEAGRKALAAARR